MHGRIYLNDEIFSKVQSFSKSSKSDWNHTFVDTRPNFNCEKYLVVIFFLFDAFVQISHTVPRTFCLIQCLHFKKSIRKNRSNEILNIQYDIRVVDVLYIAWKAEAWIIELKEITNELPTLRMSRIKYFKLVFRR